MPALMRLSIFFLFGTIIAINEFVSISLKLNHEFEFGSSVRVHVISKGVEIFQRLTTWIFDLKCPISKFFWIGIAITNAHGNEADFLLNFDIRALYVIIEILEREVFIARITHWEHLGYFQLVDENQQLSLLFYAEFFLSLFSKVDDFFVCFWLPDRNIWRCTRTGLLVAVDQTLYRSIRHECLILVLHKDLSGLEIELRLFLN